MSLLRNQHVASHYYRIKPLIPRRMQIFLRRWAALGKRYASKDIWPIDPASSRKPGDWRGWPGGKSFAFVLTHDVDTWRGQDKCQQLMALEERLGFRSSFNFVADGYVVSPQLRSDLVKRGFEVGVHGLVHNRELYRSRNIFRTHAARINNFMKEWGAVGFRSPCMYHNLEWLRELEIEYDSSTFDTDPFEPQPDGVGTIFPFFVNGDMGLPGYVELPYTIPQDFTLFILFKETTIDIWKQKVDWIVAHGGMVLVNAHPDYMNFGGDTHGYQEYPAAFYEELLYYVREKYEGAYWHALPKEVARLCRRPKKEDHDSGSEVGTLVLGAAC